MPMKPSEWLWSAADVLKAGDEIASDRVTSLDQWSFIKIDTLRSSSKQSVGVRLPDVYSSYELYGGPVPGWFQNQKQ